MIFCAIICEYNPLHAGHAYQIAEAKRLSGADAVLCVMSGNFVQRGEAAILDKYTRAKHAVLAGADAVIELPAAFATSCAELFAKGGVKLLSSLPNVKYLSFGAETPNAELFHQTAALLNDEPTALKEGVKRGLAAGKSLVRARADALGEIADNSLLLSPNDTLGVEYARAVHSMNADIKLLPVQRLGAGYHDKQASGSILPPRLFAKN